PTFAFDKMLSLHIDYCNRPESRDEAVFVQDWAERHGFSHCERVVSEVTRGVTDRSEYEKISRSIRYGFYKDVLRAELGVNGTDGKADDGIDASCFTACSPNGQHFRCGVIFGHHIGDVQENVLSNMMR
ncbi:unnamed protein product, partial [Symbiodinium microadriaticum]